MAMAVGEYRRGEINGTELLSTLPTRAGDLFNITISFPFLSPPWENHTYTGTKVNVNTLEAGV